MSLTKKENQISELKAQRSAEWQKGKENRDDDFIEDLNNEINDLKSEVKKYY